MSTDQPNQTNLEYKDSGLRSLLDGKWWQQSLKFSLSCAPRFAISAAGVAIANIIVVWASHYSTLQLLKILNNQEELVVDMQVLLSLGTVMLATLATAVVALIISLWALGRWLFELTAFARAYLLSAGQPSEKDVEDAQTYIKENKEFKFGSYLFNVWLVGMLYLLVPVLPLSVVIALEVIASSGLINLGMSEFRVTESSRIASAVLGVVLSVITLAYALTLNVFSSLFPASAGKTAADSFKQCLKHAPAVALVSFMVLSVNVAISAPQVLLPFTPVPALVKSNPVLGTIAQIWFGVTSTLLWPWSLLPYCKLLLGNPENETTG